MPAENEGKIWKDKSGFHVEITGATHLAKEPGVVCTNPEAPETERIYRKNFVKKPIYLPDEYDQAVREVLHGHDVIVIGMNGYSSLNLEKCHAYGITPGAYEAACRKVLSTLAREIMTEFPGADVRFAHGASPMGVDQAIMDVAEKLNRPQLGHSCPKFMFYVNDDEIPVYVAATQLDYAEAFIQSLDILIGANGRKQALEMDLGAAFKYLRHVVPINLIKALSTNGGPPAVGPDGKIEDATAAFEQHLHLVAVRLGTSSEDAYKNMLNHLKEVGVSITRRMLSPERAFGESWK